MNLVLPLIFMLNTLPRLLSFRASFTVTAPSVLPRRISLRRLITNTNKRHRKPIAQRQMLQFSSSTFKVTNEEEELFSTLRRVVKDQKLDTTIR